MTGKDGLYSITTISRGAGLYIGGKGISYILLFVFNILLSNTYGKSIYGFYSLGLVIVTTSVVFATLGSDFYVLRHLSTYDKDDPTHNAIVSLGAVFTVIGGGILSILIFVFAPAINSITLSTLEFVRVVRLFALAIPFVAGRRFIDGVFRGLNKIEYQILITDIIRPVGQVVVMGVAILLSLGFPAIIFLLVMIDTFTVALGLLLIRFRTHLRATVRFPTSQLYAYLNYSVPVMFSNAASILYRRTDIFMVGVFFSSSVVGVYNAAFLLTTILALPLMGFNQMFSPIVSRLYEKEEYQEIEDVYQIVTRWTFSISLLMGIFLIIFQVPILSLWGNDFANGGTILTLFVLGQLADNAAGPANNLLMMTDNQYVSSINHMVAGVANIILNYILIQEFGAIGAAAATAGILALLNIIRVLQIQYYVGCQPYSRSYLKPLIAALCTSGGMFIVKPMVGNKLTMLLIAAAGSTVLFFGLLIALGIDHEDRVLWKQIS